MLFRSDPESLENIPAWAKATMEKHAGDARPFVYSDEQLERSQAHDSLWNATQRELLLRGVEDLIQVLARQRGNQ